MNIYIYRFILSQSLLAGHEPELMGQHPKLEKVDLATSLWSWYPYRMDACLFNFFFFNCYYYKFSEKSQPQSISWPPQPSSHKSLISKGCCISSTKQPHKGWCHLTRGKNHPGVENSLWA